MTNLGRKLKEASTFLSREILTNLEEMPETAVVLGSGLSRFVERVESPTEIPYSEIPNFPVSTVPGHQGKAIAGTVGGKPVLVWSGRTHYYEGRSPDEITFYVRLTAALGLKTLFLSNAAGALTRDFSPGDLMVIEDHINLMGFNPLRGPDYEFIDMSAAYDPGLQRLLDEIAADQGLKLRHGVYVGVAGPSYETPAEIRAFGILGADLVGMSTVPEVIVARHVGMRVAAVSCITNLGAGLSDQPLSHDEVKTAALQAEQAFGDLVEGLLNRL